MHIAMFSILATYVTPWTKLYKLIFFCYFDYMYLAANGNAVHADFFNYFDGVFDDHNLQ